MKFQRMITLSLFVTILISIAPNQITESAAWMGKKPSGAAHGSIQSRPAGIDLDVTYISRTARYEWDAAKKWPDEGEQVTFTAHIRNKGTIASGAYTYQWKMDDQIVSTGTAPSILPEGESTQPYNWTWKSGRHHVGFQVDPQDIVAETAEVNNAITDPTDALTLGFWVEQSVYDTFNNALNAAGTYSWEDWAQRIVQKMNGMAEKSVYPLAPQGVLTRVRLDNITVAPDGTLFNQGPWHAPYDTIYDGRWGFSYDEWYDCTNIECYDVDWGVIHELGHYLLGRVDIYGLDVQGGDVNVLDEAGQRISGTFLLPYIAWDVVHYASRIYDVMHNPSSLAWFSEYHTYSLNRDWPPGQRTHQGWNYIYQVPSDTRIRVLDNTDQPMPNVEVSVYQALPGDGVSGAYSQNFDNAPDIVGITDSQGILSLGERPFGQFESYGITVGIDLLKLKDLGTGQYRYVWMEVTDLNLAYWSGQTGLYIHEVHFPNGSPQLHLSGTELVFSALPGTDPVPQKINVEMLGEGTQYWSCAAASVTWLRTIPDSSYGPYPSGPLTFVIDTSGLPVGTYTAALTVYGGTGVLDSPQVVSVTLSVDQPETLHLPLIVK